MPFRRSGGFRRWPGRRFSATPRRSWGRRKVGTNEGARQYAQMAIRQSLTIVDGSTTQNPSFIIQALTPWANAPEGGFDRSWELRGLVWQFDMWMLQHNLNAVQTQGPYATNNRDQQVSQVCSMFFVDTSDASGAPVSMVAAPLGPFITTTPIANPGAAPQDDEFMPTRILKRKSGNLQSGITSNAQDYANNFLTSGVQNFRWSGVLRKRISISGRQGLYLGWFGLPPPGTYPANVLDSTFWIQGTLFFFYKLQR